MYKLLLLSVFMGLCHAQTFSFKKNTGIKNKSLTVSSFILNNEFFCIAKCNSDINCMCTTYDSKDGNCNLYGKSTLDTVQLNDSVLYSKTCNGDKSESVITLKQTACIQKRNFFQMIDDAEIRFKIRNYSTSTPYSLLFGFVEHFDGSQYTYFTFEYWFGILKYNEQWEYQSHAYAPYITYGQIAGNEIFVTADHSVRKFSLSLTSIKDHSSSGGIYRGICYDQKNDLLYVASHGRKSIEVFDRNLTLLNRTINLISYTPFAIALHKNSLYVGTTDGRVLVIENETIVNVIQVLCSYVTWIYFDETEYFSTLCLNTGLAYMYNLTGSYIGKNFTTDKNARAFIVDGKGRLITSSEFVISIYY